MYSTGNRDAENFRASFRTQAMFATSAADSPVRNTGSPKKSPIKTLNPQGLYNTKEKPPEKFLGELLQSFFALLDLMSQPFPRFPFFFFSSSSLFFHLLFPLRLNFIVVASPTGFLQPVSIRAFKNPAVNFEKGGSDFRCPNQLSSMGPQVRK